jgi:uncharacterized protein YceK
MKILIVVGLVATLSGCACVKTETQPSEEKEKTTVLKVLEMKQKANSKN